MKYLFNFCMIALLATACSTDDNHEEYIDPYIVESYYDNSFSAIVENSAGENITKEFTAKDFTFNSGDKTCKATVNLNQGNKAQLIIWLERPLKGAKEKGKETTLGNGKVKVISNVFTETPINIKGKKYVFKGEYYFFSPEGEDNFVGNNGMFLYKVWLQDSLIYDKQNPKRKTAVLKLN